MAFSQEGGRFGGWRGLQGLDLTSSIRVLKVTPLILTSNLILRKGPCPVLICCEQVKPEPIQGL